VSIVSIVFDDAGELVPLVLDAATDEIHRASATATESEVERGVSIADHVRAERRQLQLNVVISDTPIAPTSDLSGEVRARDVEVKGTATAKLQIYEPASTPTRVQDSWKIIRDAQQRALLATIATKLETYVDQVLIDASVTRTAQDGTWIRAELTFVQIRQVATETVSDPTPARARGRRQQDRGSQSTREAEPQQQSLAAQAVDFFGGFF
jgi:hypothetical protein